jgi:hypothetical protein
MRSQTPLFNVRSFDGRVSDMPIYEGSLPHVGELLYYEGNHYEVSSVVHHCKDGVNIPLVLLSLRTNPNSIPLPSTFFPHEE